MSSFSDKSTFWSLGDWEKERDPAKEFRAREMVTSFGGKTGEEEETNWLSERRREVRFRGKMEGRAPVRALEERFLEEVRMKGKVSATKSD